MGAADAAESKAVLILGTAAQSPTRDRAHNAAVLRWDDQLILFDPGEGAQRQLAIAGVSPARIHRVCITHLHGDHCLGLPGFVQRRAQDGVDVPLHIHFPAAGEWHIRRLLDSSTFDRHLDVRLHPVPPTGADEPVDGAQLLARPLDHTVPAVGYRLEEPDRMHMLPGRLAALGVTGERIGRLARDGVVDIDGRSVELGEVSALGPGHRFAFVMDTRECSNAVALAADADLVVFESTFLSGEEDLAREHGHLTAAQAARTAAAAGARRLVLTHYSSRHPDRREFAADAAPHMDDVVAADDLTWIAFPPSRPRPRG